LANGTISNEQRRFAMRTLRELGLGKNSLDTLILDEVTDLVLWIKRQGGRPVNPHQGFNLAIVNTVWTRCWNDGID